MRALTSQASIEALRPDWDGLLPGARDPAVHLSADWYAESLRTHHSQDQPYAILVMRDRRPIAVAPLVVHRQAVRSWSANTIGFVENPQTPYNDFVIARDHADEVLPLLLDHLAGFDRWERVALRKLVEGGLVATELRDLGREAGLLQGTREGNRVPTISLNSWDRLWGRRSKSSRKRMRNHYNRVSKSGGAIRRRQIESSRDPLFAQMLEVSARSWKQQAGRDLKSQDADRAFYQRLCDILGPRGLVSIWMLTVEGQPAAFEFHLTHRGVVYPLRADFDEAFAALSPGKVLLRRVLQALCENTALHEYNTCGHTYPYLLDWTDTTFSHTELEIFQPSLRMSALYRMEHQLVPWMRERGLNRLGVDLAKRLPIP